MIPAALLTRVPPPPIPAPPLPFVSVAPALPADYAWATCPADAHEHLHREGSCCRSAA